MLELGAGTGFVGLSLAMCGAAVTLTDRYPALVQLMQAGKYMTGQAAVWREGDWNGDGVCDQLDLVAALAAEGCEDKARDTFVETLDEALAELWRV